MWFLLALLHIQDLRQWIIRIRQDGCHQSSKMLAMGPDWLREKKIAENWRSKVG